MPIPNSEKTCSRVQTGGKLEINNTGFIGVLQDCRWLTKEDRVAVKNLSEDQEGKKHETDLKQYKARYLLL